MAPHLSEPALQAAVDEARIQRRLHIPTIEATIARSPGHHGIRAFLRDHGFPPYLAVVVDGEPFTLDIVWAQHRVALELDGRSYHPTTPRSRATAVAVAGWRASAGRSFADLGRPRSPARRTRRGCLGAAASREGSLSRVAPIIFSGIQPTGRKHLGNYIGAINQYVSGQDRGDPAIYCIVDLHATTVAHDPAELRERVYDTTAILLAAGLDPDRCILFRQGDVKEHTELCWLLTSVTALGELNRMHQFRDKSAAQRELVSAGLLLYPVLQAADVLAYRAHEVPVGEDQREHLELMRAIAERFNARFGEGLLVVPEHRIPHVGARIRDLQEPDRKMSTTASSEQGTVYLLDDPDAIRRKFKRAVTDSDDPPVLRRGDDKPGVTNLIDILASVRGVSQERVEDELAKARGYGDLKAAVGDAVVDALAPLQERYRAIREDEQALEDVLAAGAEKARAIAAATVADVRDAMGVGGPTNNF
ncbi:MAG TPA: tryptophan--tRNA ligase [Solirubrobacteraceae bacterium]|nr:tryptophan--tRNA ligase [Solirubrobacteraceae bacterium]